MTQPIRHSRGSSSSVDGVLIVNKPAGLTSFGVVAQIRRSSGERRIGHGGTLDPWAEGVLPVFLGRATRLARYASDAGKRYRATIRFGVETTTYDQEGEIVRETSIESLDLPAIAQALARFRGEMEQVPPMYSAVQVAGRRLYELARRGQTVERPMRRVTIFEAQLMEWSPPDAVVEIACSKGTYVRTLAHDLGQALGVGAHLRALVRTQSGPFSLDEAASLDEIKAAFASGRGSEFMVAPDETVLDWQAVVLDEEESRSFAMGRRVGASPSATTGARIYSESGAFLGLARSADGQWQPEIVLGVRAA